MYGNRTDTQPYRGDISSKYFVIITQCVTMTLAIYLSIHVNGPIFHYNLQPLCVLVDKLLVVKHNVFHKHSSFHTNDRGIRN